MEKTPHKNELVVEGNYIKELLLMYNLVVDSTKNIDELNTSEIILTEDQKKENLKSFIQSYKKASYQISSSNYNNLNKITISFINLISNILSNFYIDKVSFCQLFSAYYLVQIFHKDTSEENIDKYRKSLNIILFTTINNYSYYVDILKKINLIEVDEEDEEIEEKEAQFQNKCQIIKNLNRNELNANISTFLLKNDNIPQYKNIIFPKLDLNDGEEAFNNKIKDIANLLDVIKSSLKMNTENIRFLLFKRYVNHNEKLNAINEVLSSLKKKKLSNLEENDLSLNIELYKENCSFLRKENLKSNKNIKNLIENNNEYEKELISLNQRITILSQ